MTAAAQALSLPTSDHLRPFDFHRDLGEVADLIELCFAGRLDEDGYRYVAQMRRAARNPSLISFAIAPGQGGNLSMGGYVWQENGKIVGNLSCLPIFASGERGYLIANVAVHPDHRGRGIARQLTETALNDFRSRGVQWSWLQVDDDNLPALRLYQAAGFSEVARRTTWHANPGHPGERHEPDPGFKITRRGKRDWAMQKIWLDRTYPPSVTWHLPLRKSLLQPGLRGYLNRLMSDKRVDQRALHKEGELLGVAVVQSSHSQSDKIWIAAPREHETEGIRQLLPYMHSRHKKGRVLALDFPSGQCEDALHAAGFHKHQTLIWMKRRI